MKNIQHSLLALTLAASLALVSCTKKAEVAPVDTTSQQAANVKQGDGMGLVKAINAHDSTITLDHNTIPGIMDAMAMAYPVERSELLQSAHTGDSVAFTLKERAPGDFVISSIRPIARH